MASMPTAPAVESPDTALNPAPNIVSEAQGAKCPVDHHAISQHSLPHDSQHDSQQKTAHHPETSSVPIERDADGVWHVRGFNETRAILRSTDTKQAGFNADVVTNIPSLMNQPILFLEGKAHLLQRKQT